MTLLIGVEHVRNNLDNVIIRLGHEELKGKKVMIESFSYPIDKFSTGRGMERARPQIPTGVFSCSSFLNRVYRIDPGRFPGESSFHPESRGRFDGKKSKD